MGQQREEETPLRSSTIRSSFLLSSENKPMKNIRRLIHILLRVGHHHTLQIHLSFLLPVTESSAEDTLGNIVLTKSLDFRLNNF